MWWEVILGSLPTISRCTVSFTVEHKTDKVKKELWRWVSSHPPSCPRLPRASQHPHDYPGRVPLCRVHRPDSAGCVEGAGVGPRQERGGQVRG